MIFWGEGGLCWRPLVEVSVSSWAASIPRCEAVCWHTSYCGMVKGHLQRFLEVVFLHDFQKMQILLCFFFFWHQLWCWEEAAGGLCSVFPEVYDEFLVFCFCVALWCQITSSLWDFCSVSRLISSLSEDDYNGVMYWSINIDLIYIILILIYYINIWYIILQHFK